MASFSSYARVNSEVNESPSIVAKNTRMLNYAVTTDNDNVCSITLRTIFVESCADIMSVVRHDLSEWTPQHIALWTEYSVVRSNEMNPEVVYVWRILTCKAYTPDSGLYGRTPRILISLLLSLKRPTVWHSDNWNKIIISNRMVSYVCYMYDHVGPGGRFKNTYELLNLRPLKISKLQKNHIFHCMGKIFCVEFQRIPLQFHTQFLTHTLKDVDFIPRWKFKSS